MRPHDPHRRTVLAGLAGVASLSLIPTPAPAADEKTAPLARRIPSTGEEIPAVGLGTWITFNVGNDPPARDACAAVMSAFFDAGGRLIDSSPMYASSQAVVGHGLKMLGMPRVFSAEKVWTSRRARFSAQIEESRKHWGVATFDLMQVHNLLAWDEHLPRLFDLKKAGRIRYVGITTSEGRRHAEFERVMAEHPLDFVQVTYNPVDRAVERRILPLAQERGIAVIVNRPFQQAALTQRLARHMLPDWAAEVHASSWAQLVLKFILAHPAVTCVIPATTRVDHVRENVAAAALPLPDAALRRRIADHIAAL